MTLMCNPERKTITAFKIKRAERGGSWCAFPTLETALDCLKDEMEANDFQDAYVVEPYETTQEELDGLPEFEGDFS